MRTIVDIPKADIKILDQLSKKNKVSRAELVRQAITNYITSYTKTITNYKSAFGSWKIDKIKNGLDYQQKLRDEWDK